MGYNQFCKIDPGLVGWKETKLLEPATRLTRGGFTTKMKIPKQYKISFNIFVLPNKIPSPKRRNIINFHPSNATKEQALSQSRDEMIEEEASIIEAEEEDLDSNEADNKESFELPSHTKISLPPGKISGMDIASSIRPLNKTTANMTRHARFAEFFLKDIVT